MLNSILQEVVELVRIKLQFLSMELFQSDEKKIKIKAGKLLKKTSKTIIKKDPENLNNLI